MVRIVRLATYLKQTKTSLADFARSLDPPVTPGLVGHWIKGRCRVGPDKVLKIEAATGGKVSRHELRPDLYPRDVAA